MELLSPCGNYLSLIGVINAGADAVYLAGNKYGARAYADNFTDKEIIKAIKYAHLNNVKVYLTVNTLIKESEYEDVIDYISSFYKEGLDACIVQDIGLISIFNKVFPNMECHISTQAYSTGAESVKFFKELGATRVVLARELSLNEIKSIKNECDIEIETFIHGAMCYSYSGQCLFSSCLGGRSGNRGRCAGPCRLNYEANNRSGYLLSMKDQCTLKILPELIKSGIDSFKIEGRMKRPEYAAYVTSIYRKYIDLYLKNPSKYKVDEKDIENLNSFYMRSEIGTGYYDKYNGADMISINNPAYEKTDDNLIKYTADKYLKTSKKFPLDIYVECIQNNEFSLTVVYKDICVSKTGQVVERSINRPISEEDIIKQVSKLGDTYFYALNVYVTTDNQSFYSLKDINAIRRLAIDDLEKELAIKSERIVCENIKESLSDSNSNIYNRSKEHISFNYLVNISTREQLYTVINNASPGLGISINDDIFVECLDLITDLKKDINKDNNKNRVKILINLPYVIRDNNRKLLGEYNSLLNNYADGLIINNLEELNYYKNSDKLLITGPGLYGWNNEAVKLYLSYSDSFIYSYELSQHEVKEINAEGLLHAYGRIPLMQSVNCVEKTTDRCKKSDTNKYLYLKDRKNSEFLVKRNCKSCYNTIYNSVPTSLHNEDILSKYQGKLFINFTDEKPDDVINVLNLFIMNKKGYNPLKFTRGYLKRGVE